MNVTKEFFEIRDTISVGERFLSELREVEKRGKTANTDILKVGLRKNKRKYAHRQFLEKGSSYFQEILEESPDAIDLDVSRETFTIILEFLYTTKKIRVQSSQALELFAAARKFGLKRLESRVKLLFTSQHFNKALEKGSLLKAITTDEMSDIKELILSMQLTAPSKNLLLKEILLWLKADADRSDIALKLSEEVLAMGSDVDKKADNVVLLRKSYVISLMGYDLAIFAFIDGGTFLDSKREEFRIRRTQLKGGEMSDEIAGKSMFTFGFIGQVLYRPILSKKKSKEEEEEKGLESAIPKTKSSEETYEISLKDLSEEGYLGIIRSQEIVYTWDPYKVCYLEKLTDEISIVEAFNSLQEIERVFAVNSEDDALPQFAVKFANEKTLFFCYGDGKFCDAIKGLEFPVMAVSDKLMVLSSENELFKATHNFHEVTSFKNFTLSGNIVEVEINGDFIVITVENTRGKSAMYTLHGDKIEERIPYQEENLRLFSYV